MRQIKISAGLLPMLLAAWIPAGAQLAPAQSDPLGRIREAAEGNIQACSATGESLCEQVAPKIIANAQGDSPLAENLRRLTNTTGKRENGADGASRAVAWSVAAFRDEGVDVHTEKYVNGGREKREEEQENVVAEIRGREKPDEWVLVGGHLDDRASGSEAVGSSCNAAMVIEAARDIQRTGISPRRSIRFVLFTGEEQGMTGSWAYAHTHRAELDRARAVIIFGGGCNRITGYSLNGRHDIEPGVQEAMKPIESMGAGHYGFGTSLGNGNFDFLVEGVPALVTDREEVDSSPDSRAGPEAAGNIDIAELKRNSAIVAVTAFGIAERAEPIGPRQSRAEIESLLKTSGLEQQMKTAGLWRLWESGERGRLP